MLKRSTAISKEEYLPESSNVINERDMCLRTVLLSLCLKKLPYNEAHLLEGHEVCINFLDSESAAGNIAAQWSIAQL